MHTTNTSVNTNTAQRVAAITLRTVSLCTNLRSECHFFCFPFVFFIVQSSEQTPKPEKKHCRKVPLVIVKFVFFASMDRATGMAHQGDLPLSFFIFFCGSLFFLSFFLFCYFLCFSFKDVPSPASVSEFNFAAQAHRR